MNGCRLQGQAVAGRKAISIADSLLFTPPSARWRSVP
jgi:hypothetical protein